jgi:peptidoglycan/LPS O-acetylase OafA/YrhL
MGRGWFGFNNGPLYFCFVVGVIVSKMKSAVPFPQVIIKYANIGALVLFGIVVGMCLVAKGGDSSGIKSACLAILLFISVLTSGVLQSIFGSTVGRFFGDISFPLYLIHFPLMCSVGPWLYKICIRSSVFAVDPVIVTISGLIAICVGAAWLFMLVEKSLLKWVYSKMARWL